jgi:uncharacterized RDD family membrane protein YckC
MQWYYALNGQRLGPVSHEEFVKLVTDGVIRSDSLVWSQGMAEWQPYAQVASGSASGAPHVEDGTEMCAVSGKRYPRNQMINFDGKWISAEHRDAFFQRKREGVAQQLIGEAAVPGPFGYGGFWRRAVALFIDQMIMGAMAFVLIMVFSVAIAAVAQGGRSGQPPALFLVLVFGIYGVMLLVVVFYHAFLTSKFGATWGKMAMGLKVVRPDGEKISFGRSVGRALAHGLSGILCIGYIIAAFDDQKRSLHDHICDTRVIKTR